MSIIYQGLDPITKKPILVDQETHRELLSPLKKYTRHRRSRVAFNIVLRILVYHWWGATAGNLGQRLVTKFLLPCPLIGPGHVFTDEYLSDLKAKVWPEVAILRLKGDL